MKPSIALTEAEKQGRIALNGVSVLRQISERLELPTTAPLLEELNALARAQRRTLKAAQRQMEADPLLDHLLKTRISCRKADERRTKSGKRVDEVVERSFFPAQHLGFDGSIEDWRKLLEICPKR